MGGRHRDAFVQRWAVATLIRASTARRAAGVASRNQRSTSPTCTPSASPRRRAHWASTSAAARCSRSSPVRRCGRTASPRSSRPTGSPGWAGWSGSYTTPSRGSPRPRTRCGTSPAPGSRLWDLAHAAKAFVPLSADPAWRRPDAAARLRVLADAYGLDEEQRRRLAPMLAHRARAMHDLLVRGHATGTQPWARLFAGGHGEVWRRDSAYIERHEPDWLSALLA